MTIQQAYDKVRLLYGRTEEVRRIYDLGDGYAFLFVSQKHDGVDIRDIHGLSYDVINKKTGEVESVYPPLNMRRFSNAISIPLSEIVQ